MTVTIRTVRRFNATVTVRRPITLPPASYLLAESGDILTCENGDRLAI